METINQAHRALPLSSGEPGDKASRARTALLALVLLLGCMPAFADQFYFTRTRALADAQGGATGLFLWNDVNGAQSQIGGSGAVYLRHATDGAISVGGIAASSGGILYGFAADDAATAGLLPFTGFDCRSTIRSRLVTINTSTAVITYVGAYLPSRYMVSAAFDGAGRLWAYDCVASEVVQINPATGATIGTAIATSVPTSIAVGIDFAANGLGIIGYNGLLFQTFDPDAGQVGAVPVVAQNNGFDGALVPPYAIAGVAFTNNLAARNGSPAAQDCRLNLQEHRGLDELGHANDPFFANPVIAFREAEELNPGTVAAGWFNGGPGDMTRAGGPALPDCFFDWGDAPASYATLRADNGPRHALTGPYLGSALPDFEVDGQPGPATGDNNIGTDDEGGIIVPTLTRGETVAIQVDVGGESAATRLQGWIDWDGDGSFTQPGDRILTDATVVAGANTFNVNVPITAAVGTIYARFRIADQAGLSFDGAADSGEVEDHAILVTAGEPLLTKTFAAASIPYGGSAALTFTIDNTAAGAVNQTGMAFTDNLPVGLMIATPANVASTCTGATVTANAGTSTITVSGASVPAAQTCTISVDVTNRPGYTGICYDPNFANENQNITGLNNLAAAIAQFTCLSVEPPDCPGADYTNGFDNIGGLSPNLNNGVSGQCLALLPTITLNKISEAGTGSFDFTFGNTDATNPVTIVTTAPSMPVAAGPFNVLDLAQPVTIAETGLPAGWVLSSIACITDGGDAIGSFDAGTATWTVSPDELASGQQITCTALNLAPAAIGTVKALSAESGSEPGVAEPGEQLTYTITLTNTGGVDATNYPITDVLDPNVTFVSADNGGTLAGGNVEWTGLTVPAGGSLVLTVVVEVVAPIPAGVTSIGNVAYTPTDPPPDCDVTPTPPNCVIIPTPDAIDFGDAPDPAYATLLASNGARHAVPGLDVGTNTAPLMLGATIDAEADGAPDAAALGDDGAGIDDEDAIGTMPNMAVTQSVYAITVSVRNTTGAAADLVGWVDWNRNNVFDTTEAATATVADGATTATLSWTGVSAGPLAGNTYARLRIAPAGEIDASTPIGEASAGEVEDYTVPLVELPDPFSACPVNDVPPPTDFTIRQRWATPNVVGQRTLAYQTPVVGDLFGNGQPVVVIGADDNAAGNGSGGPDNVARNLHIFRGSDGVLLDTISTPLFGYSGHAAVALADVDDDGQGEIILRVDGGTAVPAAQRGRLIAYRNDGTELWMSDQRYDHGVIRNLGLNLADFNGDGIPEVYIGNQVFNARTGVRLAAGLAAGSSGCRDTSCQWGNTAAVDMDGDGQLELVAGNVVYKISITNPNGAAGNTISVWQQANAAVAGVGDGWTAVADIDIDGDPDVVVVRAIGVSTTATRMYVWEGETNAVMGLVGASPTIGVVGGPPMLGDIDGNGVPDIVFVVRTPHQLLAYEFVPGTGLVQQWALATNDQSGQTSLTMFDFNNDGRQELVYRDETNLRIIDGSGATAVDLVSFPCTSATVSEQPVVAALDSSREARILMSCSTIDHFRGNLRAYETNSFPWAKTRPVWNQQAYFVAHVNNDLTIPAEQYPHWTAFSDPGQLCSNGINRPLNSFQQQVTDLDPNTGCPTVCAAPDVEVSKALTSESGTEPGVAEPGEQLTYTITVTNIGGMDATNYPVTDQLDPNVTFVSASNGGTLVGGNVEWTGLTVPAAGNLTLTIVVQVINPIPPSVTQIGNVAYSPTDPPPACDTPPLPPNCTVTPTSDPIDFGDAPDTYGTLLASGGARHTVPDLDLGTNSASLMLGATIDTEPNGLPDGAAQGDDADVTDDEDAVGTMPDMAVTQTAYTVTVAVRNNTGAAADLVGWVDWNRNNVFDTSEAATAAVADGATSATLSWTGLSLTPLVGNTYARLRIAPAGEIDPSTPIGEASAGEVEDHIVRLIELPDTFGSCPVNDLPPPTNFTIRQRWTTPNVVGQRTIAYQTPVVGDLFGNGQPVVVVAADNSFATGGLLDRLAKDLHIVNGSNGVILSTITTPLFNWSGHSVVAIADVDSDGQGEIILKVSPHTSVPAALRGRLVAYRNNGTQMWVSDQRYDYTETNGRGGFALGVADFNGDGVPEAYVGNQIFNAQTGVRLVTLASANSTGCVNRATVNTGCFFGQSTAADMDDDGLLELVAGNVVYKVDITNPNGAVGNTITNWRQATAAAGVGDGFTAVADIDLDGDPDVVVSRTVDATVGAATRIYVWDGQTATVMGMLANIGTAGGPPLLGDIDGDGTAEIVAVTTTNLRAFKYQAGTLVSKWTLPTNDSSGVTSLSMFDFNNDGTRELVYRDQDNIRIINGSGAAAADLATFACGSGTATDMPVIAALDSTRQARILVTCAASAGTQGQLRAYETNSFPWANTRPVWNQQAYFVTHVNNDLTIPSEQYPHWTAFNDPGQLCSSGINRPLNAFQQQVTDLDPNSGCPAVCAVADVDVGKALTAESGTAPGLAEAGEQLTYTITLTNSGGLDATNYPVTDQLDPNVTFVSASHGGTLVGGNVEWTGLTVPAAGSLQLTIVVQVADPIPDGVTQIGNVAYNPTDPPPACDTTPLPPSCTVTPTEPKIGIDKALTGENGSVPGLAEPGELLTYTITLTNTGGTDEINYGLTDALDANVTFVSASNGGALVGGNVEWTGLTVPAGGSLALTVTVRVVNPIPLGVTEVSNVAYETGTPQPNCDVTPLPANCVVIPTPEPLDCGLNVEQTIDGFAQAWTPGSSWQAFAGNEPVLAINAPDAQGVQLWFNLGNALTLDMSTVVPANEFVTLHLGHPGGFEGPVLIESSPDGTTFGGAITRTLTAIVPVYEPVNYFVPPGGARFIRITPQANGGTGTAVRVDALTYSFEFCECPDTLNWVRQGSFEEFPSCSTQSGTFGDWSVIATNVHIWGSTCPAPWTSPDGQNSVDLDGTTTGGLEQVITGLTVGNRYNLTFYQGFNPASGTAQSASMRVQIGDFDRVYTSASNATVGGFNRVYVEFTALSTTEMLRFESLTGSGQAGLLDGGGTRGFGVVIDAVRITPQDCSELPPALVEIDKELTGENGSVPDVAEAGEQLTYTITLTNSGGLDATNYPVTDQLDPNVTFVSASNGGTLVGGNVEWTGLTVPAGGSLVLTVVVQVVDPIPPGVLEIGNVAYTPTDPPPDCDVTPTPPNCTITPTEPNVTTGKSLTSESGTQAGIAEPGEQLTYTITLTNTGGTDATNYPQVDQLDPNVTFVSASNGGTLVGTQVQWTGLTVPTNGSLVLTVVVQVVDPIPDGVLSIGNVAYDPTDPPPNCDATPRPPNCTVTPTPPQLRVEKSIIAESLTLDGIAEPGEELTYSVRVRNVGGTDALNRVVNESVPANTVYVALGSDAWSCVDGSGPGTPCDFTVAMVPTNGFVDLLFRVRIDDPIPPGVTQIANAVALDGEIPPTCPPNAGDPQDPACVVIPTVPQTVVAKALTAESLGQNGQAEAGEVLTYTITVTNHGGTDDTNVVVNEDVPDYTTTAPGNQTVNGALGNWTCADLSGPGTACDLTLALVPSGGSVTVQFLVRVDDPIPDGVTQIANSVALNGDPPPPCPPAGGQCVITPTEPSVSVVKTLLLEDGTQTGVVEAGETLVYQLQVTNSGGSVALAEFLREIVPEHTTFVADPVSSPGWTCADGSPNPTVCDLVFDIGPLQTLNFLFAVEAADPIPDGVREIANGIGLGGNPPPCPPPGIHCVVTPTANLSNDKTVVSVTPVGANSYRVTYQIVMANTGGAPATYTLSDQLSYPAAGVTLLSPAIASTADGVLEPTLAANNGQFTPVNNTPVQLSAIDVPLAVGESDTYVVALTIAVDPAQVSTGTCTGAPGNGLYNSAVAVGTADAEDDACVPVPTDAPRVSLIKRNRLLDGNGNGYGDVGEPLEYSFEIANSGSTALSSVRLIDAKIRPPQGAWVQCDRPGTPGSGSFVFSAPVEVGGTITCTATYALSATDVSVRRVTNTANVTALAPDGRQVRASATSIFENFQ